MARDFREEFGADTRDGERWPYPVHIYVARLLWLLVWATVWRLCWKRLPFLRCGILKLFGARTTWRSHISGSAWIEMPWNLTLGEYACIGPRAAIYNLGPITIGAHSIVSHDAHLCGGTHDYSDPTYPLICDGIDVGEYVWIAAGAFILPGVKLAEGSVVGARAVVCQDTAEWTIVAGNPARPVGKRELHRRGVPVPLPPRSAETPGAAKPEDPSPGKAVG